MNSRRLGDISMSENNEETNNHKERVSIIIPVYNGEKYIKDTIKSCCIQNYDNLEIVLIDDYSKDNSFSILKEISEKDSRISCFRNESNLGMTKTVNEGISKSSGQYIICLGQDDILQPDHVKIMTGYINYEVALVFCQSDLINEKGEVYKIREHLENKNIDVFELSKGNRINSCGLLMNRKHIMLVNGYPETDDFPNYGEWEMWIKLASVGEIVYADKIKSFYRRHENNISRNFYNLNARRNLWRYYYHCRKLAKDLGNFSNKGKILYSFYSIIFIMKFIYRSIMGGKRLWGIN